MEIRSTADPVQGGHALSVVERNRGAPGAGREDAASEGVRLAAKIIPRAEAAVGVLRDHLERQLLTPEEDVIEGYLRIARIESSSLWLESDEGGRIYGPIAIPAAVGKSLAVDWTLSGTLAPARRGATLLEVWNVYPNLAAEA